MSVVPPATTARWGLTKLHTWFARAARIVLRALHSLRTARWAIIRPAKDCLQRASVCLACQAGTVRTKGQSTTRRRCRATRDTFASAPRPPHVLPMAPRARSARLRTIVHRELLRNYRVLWTRSTLSRAKGSASLARLVWPAQRPAPSHRSSAPPAPSAQAAPLYPVQQERSAHALVFATRPSANLAWQDNFATLPGLWACAVAVMQATTVVAALPLRRPIPQRAPSQPRQAFATGRARPAFIARPALCSPHHVRREPIGQPSLA